MLNCECSMAALHRTHRSFFFVAYFCVSIYIIYLLNNNIKKKKRQSVLVLCGIWLGLGRFSLSRLFCPAAILGDGQHENSRPGVQDLTPSDCCPAAIQTWRHPWQYCMEFPGVTWHLFIASLSRVTSRAILNKSWLWNLHITQEGWQFRCPSRASASAYTIFTFCLPTSRRRRGEGLWYPSRTYWKWKLRILILFRSLNVPTDTKTVKGQNLYNIIE